jgi:hypothetical protein
MFVSSVCGFLTGSGSYICLLLTQLAADALPAADQPVGTENFLPGTLPMAIASAWQPQQMCSRHANHPTVHSQPITLLAHGPLLGLPPGPPNPQLYFGWLTTPPTCTCSRG